MASESSPSGFIDKSKVLNVKPLRSLAPIFSNQAGQASPFTCVPPTGPFPPGAAPFYPFYVPNESQGPTANHAGPSGTPSPVPLNSFRTPPSQHATGDTGPSKRSTKSRKDGYSSSQSQSKSQK